MANTAADLLIRAALPLSDIALCQMPALRPGVFVLVYTTTTSTSPFHRLSYLSVFADLGRIVDVQFASMSNLLR